MGIGRWHSKAVGRLLKSHYPNSRDMLVHRLYGITIGGIFVGVIRMTNEPTHTKEKDHE